METKYSWQQVTLHWLSAAIILWTSFSGFYVALFDVSSQLKGNIGFFNVSLTTLFIPFFLLRLWFMFRFGKPEQDKPATLASHIAGVVHLLLYINILVVLTSGILMMEQDINIFNLLVIPQPISNRTLTRLFHHLHTTACASLSGLVLLHILAVIKHHLYGNPVLQRMWR